MRNHLPECWFSDPEKVPAVAVNDGWPCICDRLRACEQRVNSSNLTLWDRTQEQSQHMITSGLGIAWKDGFKEGLDAAREAVEAVDPPSEAYDDWHPKGKRLALSAIDTLREERSGNPDTSPSAENEAIDALREDK